MSNSGSYPRVRSACENCHRRKIRCILPTSNGSCHNCQATETSCLFALRMKSGRPRRRDASDSLPNPTWHDSFKISDSQAVTQQDEHNNFSTPPSESFSNGRYSTITGLEDFWNADEHATLMQELNDMDIINLFSPSQDPTLHGRTPSHEGGGGFLSSHQSSISLSSNNTAAKDPMLSNLGLLTPPPTTIPMNLENMEFSDGGFDFEVILKLCADLNHHGKLLREPNCELTHIGGLLGSIDSVCTTAIQSNPSNSLSAAASAALILAALYKVFEICEILVRRTSNGLSKQENQTMENLMLLKRLDIILLQAKMFLTRLGQTEAVERASSYHYQVGSLVKQFQPWTYS